MTDRVYLTRRNLLSLLSKLDRQAAGDPTACTIVKHDNVHPKYPQTMQEIWVTAVEDDQYYTDRKPGPVHPQDEPREPVAAVPNRSLGPTGPSSGGCCSGVAGQI